MENGIRPPIQMAAEAMRTMQMGWQGEANAQQIRINVQKWLEKWPEASINLMLTLPGEKESYPAATTLEGNELIFLPGFGDTQKPGHGAAYAVATVGGTHVAVSETVITEILPRGRGGDTAEEAPEAQAGWVAHVLDAAHRAEEAAQRAENAMVEFEEKDPTVPAWAKQPTKPTYTAMEVGAQPKGDYALKSEIPAPYALPVASAETLGGVKVGKGLEMDGETLAIVPGLNMPMDLLWQNSSPDSTFAIQTFALNTAGHEMLLLYFRASNSSVNYYYAFLPPDKNTIVTVLGGVSGAGETITYSRLITVSADKIAFGACVAKGISSAAAPVTDNTKCIPITIYGIRRIE